MTKGVVGFVTGVDSGGEEAGVTDLVAVSDPEESGGGVAGLQDSNRTNKSGTRGI